MRRHIVVSLLPVLIGLMACSSGPAGPYELELMPAPEVFQGGQLNPFEATDVATIEPFSEVLYVTDRAPNDGSGSETEQYYLHDRGRVLRLGLAKLRFAEGELNDELAQRMALSLSRQEGFPLSISSVEEFGILGRSVQELFDRALGLAEPKRAGDRFAAELDRLFERSSSRDVFIFVHGYRSGFEFPVLVAAELWNFMGYEGAFVGYSWPSRAKKLGYVSDLDSAATSARHLRLFLEYLHERTSTERVHMLTHSAGTIVVLGALGQLSLKADTAEEREKLSIGQVMLIGSDFDRDQFAELVDDGLLDLVDRMTIYLSRDDRALNLSRKLTGRERLGQAWVRREMSEVVRDYLLSQSKLVLVDVTDASDATTENGHRYLRKSPWVSSDMLMTLKYDLSPDDRGLVRREGDPIWEFPPDYMVVLREAVRRARLE